MEIPEHLKQLYPHWEKHLRHIQSNKQTSLINKTTHKAVSAFAIKRMHMWEFKNQGKAPPYSDDTVLNKYRFCNIYRELDRQTIDFHTLLKPIVTNKPLWIVNMLFCRLIANTETIQKIGLLSFDTKHNKRVHATLHKLPSPKYGTPYVFPISTIQRSPYPTREDFFCTYLPTIAKKFAEDIENMDNISVADAVPLLCKTLGFNLKFHITELLIDVAYQYPEHIDLFKPFPTGPGSITTISKLVPNTNTSVACSLLGNTQNKNFPFLTYNNKPIPLSAENWEGIGCEYRKYINLSKGIGRRRIYHT